MSDYFKYIEVTRTGYFHGQLLKDNLSEEENRKLIESLQAFIVQYAKQNNLKKG